MIDRFREEARWAIVVTFAIAMAWVEAPAVFYIRALVDRIQPYQANPLPINGALGNVELCREAATLVMLGAVGMLAGRAWRQRAGYAALAFGVWDIFYYVFLRLISGWPKTVFDWDILFLLPLPWWGPVIAPVSIALVMILWGTLVTQWHDAVPATRVTRASWGVSGAGILLALGVFMADAIRPCPRGSTLSVRCCRRHSTGRYSAWHSCSWLRHWRTRAGGCGRVGGRSAGVTDSGRSFNRSDTSPI